MIEMFWDNLFSFVFGVAVSAIFFGVLQEKSSQRLKTN